MESPDFVHCGRHEICFAHIDGLPVDRTRPGDGRLRRGFLEYGGTAAPQVDFGAVVDEVARDAAAEPGAAAGDEDALAREGVGGEGSGGHAMVLTMGNEGYRPRLLLMISR
ncbi:hypothetical protein MLGJGCBP_05923 [Rhodococcus sp. T7]|nr:hypothetical protein MLGJGCBP_05923 [Rhodococcus sp. T7]